MVYLSSYFSHAYVRWTLGAYYGLSLVDQSFPGDHVTGIFSFLSFYELYIMGCMLLGVLWSGSGRGRSVTMTTRLLRGWD